MMNRPDVYERSVSVLIKAFLNETLAKGTCNACAVGNLCAAAIGHEVSMEHNYPWVYPPHAEWRFGNATSDDWTKEKDRAERLVERTGYEKHEFFLIEETFEDATRINHTDYDHGHASRSDIIEDQYAGLLAVFSVLQQIHEVDETDAPARLMEARENLLA